MKNLILDMLSHENPALKVWLQDGSTAHIRVEVEASRETKADNLLIIRHALQDDEKELAAMYFNLDHVRQFILPR